MHLYACEQDLNNAEVDLIDGNSHIITKSLVLRYSCFTAVTKMFSLIGFLDRNLVKRAGRPVRSLKLY